jgi:hypothetical protein
MATFKENTLLNQSSAFNPEVRSATSRELFAMAVLRLNICVSQIMKQFQSMTRSGEARDFNLIQDNSNYVQNWSMMQILVVVLCTVVQVGFINKQQHYYSSLLRSTSSRASSRTRETASPTGSRCGPRSACWPRVRLCFRYSVVRCILQLLFGTKYNLV